MEPLYEREIIAKCNGKEGRKTWIVVDDGVYDVTNFLDEHPGGKELIQEFAGRDATKAFHDNGHSSDAKSILASLKIGETLNFPRDEEQPKNQSKEKNDCLPSKTCGCCII